MTQKQFNFHSEGKLEFKEANLKGEKKYYIEGYASTTNKDLAGEVINQEAQASMLKQFRNRNITIDIEHEEWYDADGKQLTKPKGTMIPVAKIIEAKLDSTGTFIKAEMNTSIERFDEVWGSIKGGFLNSFSIGFFPITQVGNVISDLNIVNLTLTGTPINKDATFTPVLKSAVAYLKSIDKESELKMVEGKPKEEPKVEVPTETKETPKEEPTKELKTEEEVKQEIVTETKKEVKTEETKEVTKEQEITDLVGKIMETKLKEWEDKFLKSKSDDEPKKETKKQEPKAPQEVPSKPITPLGMIKAFKKRQGELGNTPKLKALVGETPEVEVKIQKTRTPLQLI